MAGKSDYLENEVLDHVLGGGDYTRPATVYVALFNVAPTDAGGGTEFTGGNYARLAVTNNATNFPAASGGSKSNGVDFTFPETTASHGTLVAVGIYDALTVGNLMFWNTVTNRTIDAGVTINIPSGSMTFTED